MREHGILVYTTRGMNSEEVQKSLNYGTNYSDIKEKAFVQKELAEKLRVGHVDIYPLADIKNLVGL